MTTLVGICRSSYNLRVYYNNRGQVPLLPYGSGFRGHCYGMYQRVRGKTYMVVQVGGVVEIVEDFASGIVFFYYYSRLSSSLLCSVHGHKQSLHFIVQPAKIMAAFIHAAAKNWTQIHYIYFNGRKQYRIHVDKNISIALKLLKEKTEG